MRFRKSVIINLYASKYKRLLNIDNTVFFSLLGKTWGVIKTPLSVIFITKYLTPLYQGYWFTFLSLGALTVFAELGFTAIVIQYISYEFAYLKLNADGRVEGEQDKIESFISLIKFSISRYLVIIPVGIAVILLIGFVFFRSTLYSNNLIIVWVIYALTGGLTLLVSLLTSIIQGINKVKHALQINLYANIISTLSIWIVLLTNGGIWALPISSFLLCVCSVTLIHRSYKNLFVQIYGYKIKRKFLWGKEVYKLQLNYSISWIAGYFIFSFITPVTLYFLGPVIAGKVGITMSATAALLQMAHSWVLNKMPQLNMFISLNSVKEATSMFQSLNRSSIMFFIFSSAVVLLILEMNFFNLQNKFLSVGLTIIVLLSEFAKLVFGNWAVYLRSFKIEPFLKISVLNGCFTFLVFMVSLKFFHSLNYAIFLFTIIQYISIYYGRSIYLKKINN